MSELEERLRIALEECSRLRGENSRLREILAAHGLKQDPASPADRPETPIDPSAVTNLSSPDAKLALFRRLFRGREDVYAVRWERGEKSGYSPASIMDWPAIRDAKPEDRKKVARKTRSLLPLTDEVVRQHLEGKATIGVYPLLPDETCWFLAVDFDKASWQKDVAAFRETCQRFSIPAVMERSRSGNGAHAWMFFDRPVLASDARRLGCALLTRTTEMRHEVGLNSYDRLFPNQDTMPKGGFGNLIALPLQRGPRKAGNSVFVDDAFQAYPDQWHFLWTVKRIPVDTLASLIREVAPEGDVIGVRIGSAEMEGGDSPWLLPPSRKRKEKPITGPLPSKARAVLSNLVYIERTGLPAAMLDRLIRLAAFQNPEFYKAQAMRLSTYGKPRVISCAESFPEHIGLPRGCLEEVVELFRTYGIDLDVRDERTLGASSGRPISGNVASRPNRSSHSDDRFGYGYHLRAHRLWQDGGCRLADRASEGEHYGRGSPATTSGSVARAPVDFPRSAGGCDRANWRWQDETLGQPRCRCHSELAAQRRSEGFGRRLRPCRGR